MATITYPIAFSTLDTISTNNLNPVAAAIGAGFGINMGKYMEEFEKQQQSIISFANEATLSISNFISPIMTQIQETEVQMQPLIKTLSQTTMQLHDFSASFHTDSSKMFKALERINDNQPYLKTVPILEPRPSYMQHEVLDYSNPDYFENACPKILKMAELHPQISELYESFLIAFSNIGKVPDSVALFAFTARRLFDQIIKIRCKSSVVRSWIINKRPDLHSTYKDKNFLNPTREHLLIYFFHEYEPGEFWKIINPYFQIYDKIGQLVSRDLHGSIKKYKKKEAMILYTACEGGIKLLLEELKD